MVKTSCADCGKIIERTYVRSGARCKDCKRKKDRKHNREHAREYIQRPEVKKRRREYRNRPEVKAKKREQERRRFCVCCGELRKFKKSSRYGSRICYKCNNKSHTPLSGRKFIYCFKCGTKYERIKTKRIGFCVKCDGAREKHNAHIRFRNRLAEDSDPALRDY